MADNKDELGEVRSALLKVADRLSALQSTSSSTNANTNGLARAASRNFNTSSTTVASEQRRLFGYAARSNRKGKTKGKSTCTLKFVCLASKNATSPPATIQERTTLANSGLGDGSVTFSPEDIVYNALMDYFPPLKEAGGFELYLYQRGGGEGSGFHIIQPPHMAMKLKELAGQAKIYIKPLQRDLKISGQTVANVKIEGSIPSVECFICKDIVPMNEMQAHQSAKHGNVLPAKKQKTLDGASFSTAVINVDDGDNGGESDGSVENTDCNGSNTDDESIHDNSPFASPCDPPNSQIQDVLVRMFPQHTLEYLQAVAESNDTLQSAIDSILDSAQRRAGNQLQSTNNAKVKPKDYNPTNLGDLLQEITQTNKDHTPAKVQIDPSDVVSDTIAYYKTPEFDGSKRLRVSFVGQPAIDVGGISRQFFPDAIEAIATSSEFKLFEGPDNRQLPSYNSTSLYSGLFEVLGRLVGHSILQTSVGYPCLAPHVYWYIATGDVQKALPYLTINDIMDEEIQGYINKVATADSKVLEDLKEDEKFISLCSDSGLTTTISEKTKNLIVQCILLHHGINRKTVLLDQFRSGLKDVNLLQYIEKYPTLFEPLFVFHQELMDAKKVKEMFKEKAPLNENQKRVWDYLMTFIDKCSQQDLKALVRFLTGSSTLSATGVSKRRIQVSFSLFEGAIFSSTCLLTLQLPEAVESYEQFDDAMRVVMSDGLFNVV